MRYFLFFILFICTINAFAQSSGTDDNILSNQAYQETLSALWMITNSREPLAAKQEKIFNLIAVAIKKYPKDERNFSFLPDGANLSLVQLDSLISMTDTSLNRSAFKNYAIITRNRVSVTETGKRFPAVSINDTAGRIVPIGSLEGKIVLIDIWSSWCMPCRTQIPGLIKVYNKYHVKGFEIIGVSLDSDKAAWLKAIEKDKQVWNHYSQLTEWSNSIFFKRFYITAIPDNYLLDSNGIILGQNLSPEQVELLVKENLK